VELIERQQGADSQAVNRKPVNRESDKASSGAMDRTDIPILDRIAARIVGASGADIERMVRDARRIARRARRPLEADDLLSLAPPPLRLSDEERWRFAVHEIGHAVAIITSSSDHLLSVWMIGKDEAGPREGGMIAAAQSRPPGRAVFTLADLETELVKLVAGTAAEAVLLGSRSTGASGEANSDLARTTQIAARIELHHGLGHSLAAITSEKPQEIVRLLQRDQGLRDRVENRIRTAYNKAEALIRDNVDIVEELAQELMERGELRGDEVRQIVERASGRDASSSPRWTSGPCPSVTPRGQVDAEANVTYGTAYGPTEQARRSALRPPCGRPTRPNRLRQMLRRSATRQAASTDAVLPAS